MAAGILGLKRCPTEGVAGVPVARLHRGFYPLSSSILLPQVKAGGQKTSLLTMPPRSPLVVRDTDNGHKVWYNIFVEGGGEARRPWGETSSALAGALRLPAVQETKNVTSKGASMDTIKFGIDRDPQEQEFAIRDRRLWPNGWCNYVTADPADPLSGHSPPSQDGTLSPRKYPCSPYPSTSC